MTMKYIFVIYVSIFILLTPILYAKEHSSKKESNTYSLKAPEYLISKDVNKDPEPYNVNEFEDWMYFAFRFLAVSVGSFPFSIILSTAIFDTYRTIVESKNAGYFKSQYLPLFFKGADAPPYTSDEVSIILLTSLGISLTVGMIDLIIAVVKNTKKKSLEDIFKEEFTRNTY